MNNLVNTKLKCIAVDDEPFALKIIEDFCERIPSVELLHCFNNPVEAYHYLQHHKPDIVFLDIQMPDISGIKLAESIKALPFVIFTTAHTEYAVTSYNLDAIDYLLKPFDFERFYKAVRKAQKHVRLINANIEKGSEYITLKVEYRKVKIDVNDILYLESSDNYLKIHLEKKHYMPKLTMKSVLSMLPPGIFLRVHKSYAVAKNKIDFFSHKEVSVNNISIPIGRTYLSDFLRGIDKK